MQAAVGAAINGSSPQPSLEDCSWIIMGNESIKRNGVAHIVNKSPKCSTWVQSQKWQNDLCSFPRQPFNITVIQVYVPTSNAEDTEAEKLYEDLLELESKKMSFSL